MTSILSTFYRAGVPVPLWAPVMLGAAVVLILVALAIDPNRRRA